MIWIGMALFAAVLAGCEGTFEPTGTTPSEASPEQSIVTLPANQVQVGSSVTATLIARDAEGDDLTGGGLIVAFTSTGGTSQGSFGATTDLGNGRYQATYTGTAAGTAATIGATIDGEPVTSSLPTLTVIAQPPDVPPGVSPENSVVTVSAGQVDVGDAVTVTLQSKDGEGNDVTEGGLTVVFNASGGTSHGSFGPTTDHDNGQYSASFTGTYAGSPTTISATINGSAVGTDPPTIQVTMADIPPGDPVCEATGSATCWYVAASAPGGGSGTFSSPFRIPQDAVNQAGPGDFIYLRGGAEFTHAHALEIGTPVSSFYIVYALGGSGNDGAPGQLITLKSYPGEQAVIRGQFTQGGELDIKLAKDYWRVEGLRIFHGVISVGHSGSGLDVEHVQIVGNHISDVRAQFEVGNFGLINIAGQTTQGGTGSIDHSLDPAYILVANNIAERLFTPSGAPWSADPDVEHHACLAGYKWHEGIVVRDNTFRECAAGIYFKFESLGDMLLENNVFENLRVFGRSRAHDVQCTGNTVTGIQMPGTFPFADVC